MRSLHRRWRSVYVALIPQRRIVSVALDLGAWWLALIIGIDRFGASAPAEQIAEHLGFTPQKVAVELNRRLIRTEKYETVLKGGDEVEIVTFVGGG